jgi:hypothetical protein
LLVGCGEDNNDAVAVTPTTAAFVDGAVASAEVAFIEQANALCVEQQKAVGGLIGPAALAGEYGLTACSGHGG